MLIRGIYYFGDEHETGYDKVPQDSLILVKNKESNDVSLHTIKDKSEIDEHTTFKSMDSAKSLDNTGNVGANKVNGSVMETIGIQTSDDLSFLVPDFLVYDFYKINLEKNISIKNPLNVIVGQRGDFIVHQNDEGGKNIEFEDKYIFVGNGEFNKSPNAINVYEYKVIDFNKILISLSYSAPAIVNNITENYNTYNNYTTINSDGSDSSDGEDSSGGSDGSDSSNYKLSDGNDILADGNVILADA